VAGDLLDLLAGGSSVHEAADRLGTSVGTLREQLVALRRAHACSSTAEVVRRVRHGH
jgi:DNA-binding NarL/FixJ family response regulator